MCKYKENTAVLRSAGMNKCWAPGRRDNNILHGGTQCL